MQLNTLNLKDFHLKIKKFKKSKESVLTVKSGSKMEKNIAELLQQYKINPTKDYKLRLDGKIFTLVIILTLFLIPKIVWQK